MNPPSEQTGGGKPQYFQSWQGYSMPMQPYGPVKFGDTKTYDAFYQAYYEGGDKLVRFVKFMVHRQLLGNFPLVTPRPAGSLIFFPVCDLKELATCPDISYESTEGKDSYFEGHVGPLANSVVVKKVTRQRLYDQTYTYWPNGKIRQARTVNADGSVKVLEFDQSGRETK